MADVTLINVLKFIIEAMVITEKISNLTGEAKKNTVIDYLKIHLAQYDKYKDIIPMMIEVVIIISRTKLLINVKNKVSMWCIN